jgi:hypothetical protein
MFRLHVKGCIGAAAHSDNLLSLSFYLWLLSLWLLCLLLNVRKNFRPNINRSALDYSYPVDYLSESQELVSSSGMILNSLLEMLKGSLLGGENRFPSSTIP